MSSYERELEMIFGKKKDDISIRFCGSGGMGVILASVILGTAAILDNKNAIQTQSYGAEQRGTKVKSDVIISSRERINYPVVEKADILVALSKDAFDYFFPYTNATSKIFINSSLIQLKDSNEQFYNIPANNLAANLNFVRGINLIMLGSLIKITHLVSIDSIKNAMDQFISANYRDINLNAFQKGYDYL